MSSPLSPPELDADTQTDHCWDNRRLILAALAPRPTSRPARRTTSPPPGDEPAATDTPDSPGLASRGTRAASRGLGKAAAAFNRRIPPERRGRAAVLATGAVIALVGAHAGVKALTADISPPAPTAAPVTAPPPPVSQAPLIKDAILTGVRATDKCPRDTNYADVNRAFDGDLNTAWVCTRATNKDGQLIQVNFGRQVTLSQIRIDGGFDAHAPDGTDQWAKHRIVTKLELYFPKELNRAPITVETGGARDFRIAAIDPPAVITKLLLRVAETSEPPPANAPTRETTTPSGAEDVTTVAISEIQFIGHNAT
jgi:hypothetical protein